MKNNLPLKINAKYNLELLSHGKRKQILEALELLKTLYPYKIEKDSIILRKLSDKNLYEVCVLKMPIKRELKIGYFIVSGCILFLILISSLVVTKKISEKKRNAIMIEKEIEKNNAEKMIQEKEKQKHLEDLETEYKELLENGYESVFSRIQFLQNNLISNTTIENLTIDKKTFSIDVETKDAIQILANFENAKEFSSVKMIRTTVVGNKDIVTFSGNFSKIIPELKLVNDIDSKLEFYENEVSRIRLQKEKRIEILSDYIKYIREKLRDNNCNEQYIQLKGTKENIEVECFIYSSSKAILNFLNVIQNQDENIFDINLLKLRNSSDPNRIQTTISFVSGISVKEFEIDKDYIESLEDVDISEIEKMFTKKIDQISIPKIPVSSTVSRVIDTPKNMPIQSAIVENFPHITYIGMTKKNGNTYILAKDDVFGTFYTILMVENEISGDCCMVTRNGYKAKLNGKYYEVIK